MVDRPDMEEIKRQAQEFFEQPVANFPFERIETSGIARKRRKPRWNWRANTTCIATILWIRAAPSRNWRLPFWSMTGGSSGGTDPALNLE